MIKYLKKAVKYVYKLGFYYGLSTFIKFLKQNGEIKLKIQNLGYPVFLRAATTDINVFKQIFIDHEYEFDFQSIPETIIDAGANIGLATLFFMIKYPDSKIICIEPEKANYSYLVKNIKSYPKVIPIQAAINFENDPLEVVDTGSGNWGFMTKSTKDTQNNDPKTTNSITADDIIKSYNFKSIDIFKIDIEGFEKELFTLNFTNWLSRTKNIIIETHDWIKPGCSKADFSALIDIDYNIFLKGENIFITLN